MSKFGLVLAKLFGKKLPQFSSQADAERYYYQLRDEKLRHITSLADKASITLDYSSESLKTIERWYFDLFEADAFKSLGTSRKAFEAGMRMYYGEVAHRNAGAQWVVQEFVFVPRRYELGITKGLLPVMLGDGADYLKTPNNKRRQSLYRDYKEHFGI